MSGDAGKMPGGEDAAAGKSNLAPKDVASGTVIGTATRIAVGQHKAKTGSGRPSAGQSNLMTAVLVAGIMVGMLAIMIVFGR